MARCCKRRHKNPGEQYHNLMFQRYLKDSDVFKIGSQPYIAAIAKAYEHLKSAQASVRENPLVEDVTREGWKLLRDKIDAAFEAKQKRLRNPKRLPKYVRKLIG